MDIYEQLRAGVKPEDIADAFAAQLNEAEARIKAEEEAARKEAEDAKVQKVEDIKNIIYSFGEMVETHYPEMDFKAEELDEQTLDSLAAIVIMLLDVEAMKRTAPVRIKPAKPIKTNTDTVFKEFFKSLGL